MATPATFESFQDELNRLVESFGQRLAEFKQPGYAEAQLRDDFLNPFFRSLGWDMENRAGLIQQEREVEIESATQIGGGRKRADYFFRADKRGRFVCEAKKPAEELSARYAFQAKRYAWNKGVPLAVLTDFEELKIYVVGGKPYMDEPQVGEWKVWHFRQYPLIARELWDLLARDRVAAGSIDAALDALPKKTTGKGKARQQWLIKPDRTRALDTDFLEFLDENRRDLASDLYKHNDHDELLDGNKLTEACQRIIDRILFLRICEDRDIDTGTTLQSIVETWRKNTGDDDSGRRARQNPLELNDAPPANYGSSGLRAPKDSLWRAIVRHFRALDRRPPTHVPFFNGNLFKPHFTETLVLGDEWLAGFIGELSDDETPYLFSEIPVEILGSVYERFLGKVVRPQGKGITVEEKPEVRKAGGVYYTPRYIVDYIVEQTAGKLLDEICVADDVRSHQHKTGDQRLVTSSPTLKEFEKRTAALRLLDPACGSGSFLIRAFERVCEHWQKRLTDDFRGSRGDETPTGQIDQSLLTSSATAKEWRKKHRPLCWVDDKTGDVHLTVALKRQILTQNIYGVDLDAAAVEVTQLSLYLKMLEGESRTTLQRQRKLLSDEAEIALLPPLQDNIKHGNSLIASDFSMMPEDLVRVHAFDWPVQFPAIMKAGGFDAVIGNPPYGRLLDKEGEAYTTNRFSGFAGTPDVYVAFIERGLGLLRKKGRIAYIVPSAWLGGPAYRALRELILSHQPEEIIALPFDVFADAYIDTATFVVAKDAPTTDQSVRCFAYGKKEKLMVLRLAQADYSIVPVAVWKESPDLKFVLSVGIAKLVSRLLKATPTRVSDLIEMKRGVLFDPALLTPKKTSTSSHRYFEGDVYRYEINFHAPNWVEYGPKMKEWPKEFRWFEGRRLLMRRLVNRQQRLMTALAESTFITNKNLYSILPKATGKKSERANYFILGLLNSRLLSRLYLSQVQQATKDDFPQVTIADVLGLPCPEPTEVCSSKLADLAEKLMLLVPKLRAATSDAEKSALQNAVTATDHQIDQLVYDLYALTPEEIQLVEGSP